MIINIKIPFEKLIGKNQIINQLMNNLIHLIYLEIKIMIKDFLKVHKNKYRHL
jgi:hypothetical protein